MKKILKTLLPCCLIATSCTPLYLTTSCNTNSDLIIDVKDRKQICKEHDFSIKYTSNKRLPEGTRIGIVGVGSELYVDEDKTEIGDHGGKIAVRINSAIHYDKHFHFALSFSDDETDVYIEGLDVYYVFQEDDYRDLIAPTQTFISQTDNWEYVYKFQFNNMPLSKIKLRIIGGQSYEKIEIQQQLVDVVKEGSFYYLYVPIHLSYDVVENDFLTFDLEMSFTNSYGYTQIENLNDNGCEFKLTPTDTIPDVFFKINDSGSCDGFKDNVSTEAISHFTTLKIPQSAHAVRKGSFALIDGNPDSFKTITKIVLHSDIVSLENNVFVNFHNIEVIDMSDCNEMPFWLTRTVYVPFATKKGTHTSGIVLVGVNFTDKFTTDATRRSWIDALERHGIGSTSGDTALNKWKNSWTVYSTYDEITTDDWFTTIEDKDHNIVLTGINKDKCKQEDMRKIGLIKIPDNVTKIEITDTDATFARFSEFGCAFDAFESYDRYYVDFNYGRRLILGKNLREINLNSDSNGAFYHAGICGNIVLPNSLESIGAYAFNNCDYLEPTMKTVSNYGIEYGTHPSLGSIDSFAFSQSLIEYIKFPASLYSLGDNLFGTSADADTCCPQLNSIDFSAFGDAPTEEEMSADKPLDGIDVKSSGSIYIDKYSIKDEWSTLLIKWNNSELVNWTIELK